MILIASGDKYALRRIQENKRVQELPSPKQSSIHLVQTRFIANRLPLLFDYADLMVDDGNRIFCPEQKGWCSCNAGGYPTAAITVVNEHGLRSLLPHS